MTLDSMLLQETETDTHRENGASAVIEACQRGEQEAFRLLFERHKDRVYTIALRYAGDPATAQDIAQEVFLKLYSGIGSFRGSSNFDSWLYRLVVNACFDQKRKTRRLTPLPDDLLDFMRAPGASALDEVLRAEMSGNVRAVVDSLQPEQRILIVLRYSQSLSYEQLAEIFRCSTGTIASRLNRAHKTIEKRLLRRQYV